MKDISAWQRVAFGTCSLSAFARSLWMAPLQEPSAGPFGCKLITSCLTWMMLKIHEESFCHILRMLIIIYVQLSWFFSLIYMIHNLSLLLFFAPSLCKSAALWDPSNASLWSFVLGTGGHQLMKSAVEKRLPYPTELALLWKMFKGENYRWDVTLFIHWL
jgi:hypothetical protein